MSSEIMLSFLSNCSQEQQLGFRIVTQCAPVLKGIKASNLITVKKGTYPLVRKHLKGSSVICVPLYGDEEKEVLFLYRHGLLTAYLERKDVRDFLKKCGYDRHELPVVLARLKKRYRDYMTGQCGFPHELGIVLEYPVEDVEGFIRNQGQNCLMKKYWKVYHNQSYAEQVFRMYDEVRETALWEVVEGYPLCRIAV